MTDKAPEAAEPPVKDPLGYEIKNRDCFVIRASMKETCREAVIEAVAAGANLSGANLTGATIKSTEKDALLSALRVEIVE